MKFITVLSILALFPALCMAQGKAEESKRLHELFESDWQYQMEQSPLRASLLGDRRWNDRWDDLRLEAFEHRREHLAATLSQVRKIDRGRLSAADQLNYDLFIMDGEKTLEEYKFRTYLMPLNQMDGIQVQDQLADQLRFETVKDYDDWIKRLDAFPDFMQKTIALMREGVQARMLSSKIVLQRVSQQIEKQLVGDPAQSPFYRPFRTFPSDFPPAERERLQASGRKVISARVIPAYKEFQSFFNKEYLPATFPQVGVWQIPSGNELYAFEVRKHTTTNLTPEQIHQKGLAEVARIRKEMQQVMERVGFQGTLLEFFQKLRTDKQFYYRTPEELLTAYRATAKRIDPNLVKLFRTLPRIPYGVIQIPDNVAPDTTTAYYNPPAADGSRPGFFYVNLYKPEVRPKYEMMSLALHESVPGHHLQIALAQELGEIPKFRRYGDGYTAYVEGWGLYAESLGDEMGLYDDPYSKFGQLTYEMWRAVRLVVDTGMHHYKWERQKAIEFFRANAAKTDQDIVNEIDRYIADPGQALAYKIGELKIKELRARAKSELADMFDVREFHDVVLLSGAVPLDVLERNVVTWLEQKKQKQRQK